MCNYTVDDSVSWSKLSRIDLCPVPSVVSLRASMKAVIPASPFLIRICTSLSTRRA